MPVSENLLNSAIVKREIKAQPPTVYEDDYGLPFYYTMDFSFAAWLIFIGIGLFIIEFIIMSLGFILPFYLKKYICTRCKRVSRHIQKPEKCKICGGEIILLDEYNKNLF